MPKIVFVCTGNTCRSPMAEFLFRQLIKDDPDLNEADWEIISVGIYAMPGQKPSPNAVKVLKEEEIDLTEHRSQQLAENLIIDSDLILTMTRQHKEMIKELVAEVRDRVFTLKEFARIDNKTFFDFDIIDPFGQSEAVYRKTRDEIKNNLRQIIGNKKQSLIKEGNLLITENIKYGREGIMKIALGSDHAGYEMKAEIIDLINELGFKYEDFGTDSSQSVDYPDYAYKVAAGVASGDFDRGILICGTGIGMSISANKVEGVRAALCHDVFSARATRNHNNANVLTLGARVIGLGLAREIAAVWLGAEFDGGRHQRRVDKIHQIERGEFQ